MSVSSPQSQLPGFERPDFSGDGGDNSAYGVFVWETEFKGDGELLQPLSWK